MVGKDAATVERLVKQFTQTERTILALYYCEELTPAEIGQVLDIAELDIIEMLGDMRQRTSVAVGAPPETEVEVHAAVSVA